MILQPFAALIFWLLSSIFGGELSTSATLSVLYPGDSHPGESQTGVALPGAVALNTWGEGPLKLVTDMEFDGVFFAITALATVGVEGNLISSKGLNLDYFVLPQAGLAMSPYSATGMFGAKA